MFFLSTQLYVLLQKWLCFPLLVMQTQECSYPQVCAWAIAKHRNQNKYLCCMHGITNQSYFFLGWEYNVCKGCVRVSVHLLRFSIKPITLFLFCIPYCSCRDNDDIIIFNNEISGGGKPSVSPYSSCMKPCQSTRWHVKQSTSKWYYWLSLQDYGILRTCSSRCFEATLGQKQSHMVHKLLHLVLAISYHIYVWHLLSQLTWNFDERR